MISSTANSLRCRKRFCRRLASGTVKQQTVTHKGLFVCIQQRKPRYNAHIYKSYFRIEMTEHKVKQVPLDIKGHRMLFYAMPYYCCKEAKYKLYSKEQNDAGNTTRINVYFIRFEMPDFFSI